MRWAGLAQHTQLQTFENIAKQMNEEAESTENSGLSDNVKMVFEINKSVSSLLQMRVKISVNVPICDRLTVRFKQWTALM